MVLVVDDDEIDRIVVTRALDTIADDIRLETARDGEEAFEILLDREPALSMTLVLLDLNMNRMSGFDFLHTWQQDRRLARIAVFVMTSSWRQQDIERAYAFPIAGYIVKKDEEDYPHDLLKLVQGYLRLVQVV